MTHSDMLKKWPCDRSVATDLSLPLYRVRKWRQRSVVPSGYWLDLIEAARKRRIRGVTLRALAEG